MVSKAFLLLAAIGIAGLADALRLEEGGLERPRRDKKKAQKKKATFAEKWKNFWAEEEVETTTPAPTWNGLPIWYKDHVPLEYFNMTHMQRQDFFFRMERWHLETQEWEEKQKCRSPREGEKVVYFIQHGDVPTKQDDAPLWDLGILQSRNVKYDPMMQKAILDPKHRPQVVMVGPARKTLQTAVVGFSDIFPEAAWELETDIRGFGFVEGNLVPALGSSALYNMSSTPEFSKSATMLLSQYRDLPQNWDKDSKPHKDRWFDFTDNLLHRPEERFIVVTHAGMIKQANATKTHPGSVNIRALLPDRSWRKLSPPQCWP